MIRNIAVVSLSRGVLGEAFAQHEVEIGLQRLAGYGVNVRFMPNARRGIDYLTAHPEARAADLLQAFRDPGIDMILCAIGGGGTHRPPPPPRLFYTSDRGAGQKGGGMGGGGVSAR